MEYCPFIELLQNRGVKLIWTGRVPGDKCEPILLPWFVKRCSGKVMLIFDQTKLASKFLDSVPD